MTASRTVYTARFQTPDRIQRGLAWTVACPVYFGAALVTPLSGTCTVTNASGEQVAQGAITEVADVAEFTILANETTGQDLGERWLVSWSLSLTGSIPLTTRNTAALVLVGLLPVIADADLFRRSTALDYGNPDRVITDATSYQEFREEAWVWLDYMLVGKGRRPQLIMSSTDLRECHINKTLELIYRDLSQRNADAYLDTANRYESLALSAFGALRMVYDDNEDGQADSNERKSAGGVLWLGSRGTRRGNLGSY